MDPVRQPAIEVPRPTIIDTDLSFDDYVALLFLLQHPAMDVRAVTVANGVAHVKPGIENARRLLALVNRPDIPVAGGPEAPLSGTNAFPASWRWIFDYGIRVLLPRSTASRSRLEAADLIQQQLLACSSPMTFVALAPLTNLALVLRRDPSLVSRIETVVLSGGALQVPGTIHADVPANPNTVSEWNLYLDPTAADIVFQSGVPISLVPLDVTHVHGSAPLLFRPEFVRRLRSIAQGRASRLLVRLVHFWQLATPQCPATPIWDGAVAALAADPRIGKQWRELGIKIVLGPEAVAGQTIIDASQPNRVRVRLEGDQQAFEAAYTAIVASENRHEAV